VPNNPRLLQLLLLQTPLICSIGGYVVVDTKHPGSINSKRVHHTVLIIADEFADVTQGQ